MRLRGKVAAVTGGARGIGQAIAAAYAREGALVTIGDIDDIAAERAAAALSGESACLDVTDSRSVSDFMAKLIRRHGRLDVLVNNAGSNNRKPLLDLTEEDFDRVLAVCLKGVFLMTQAAGREMVARGVGGSIVNIASISAQQPHPGIAHYGAAKAGVAALTRSAALELAPHGIRVNAIAPGVIRTALTADTLAQPEVRSSRLAKIPLGRFGDPEDISPIATFLASDESAFMTGSVITSDGGQLLV